VPAALDQRRRIGALEDCLRNVSAKVRAALLSRYQHNLSYEEIAESCGDKPGTLQARVTRALPVLRRCLEGKGVEP
jgi:DNA-directed RNA polymerase specialized sigma24 family protein